VSKLVRPMSLIRGRCGIGRRVFFGWMCGDSLWRFKSSRSHHTLALTEDGLLALEFRAGFLKRTAGVSKSFTGRIGESKDGLFDAVTTRRSDDTTAMQAHIVLRCAVTERRNDAAHSIVRTLGN
jgi:hypothetical protein